MASEAETTIHWEAQVASIRQRYEAALRQGETIDELEVWLRQVPESVRPYLREQLQQCGAGIGPAETPVVGSSDAALGCAREDDRLFSPQTTARTDAVRECRTFQGLSPAAARALSQRLEPKSLPAGTELLHQGEAARGLILVLQGSVDVVDTQSACPIALGGAGTVLGEMSLLTGQPCSATVTATSNVEALVLSTESYEQLRQEHPELEIALSQLVSDRLGGRAHDALCGKTIGRYQLVRCINRGGMGVVYEAKKRLGDREPVALKMLRHRFIYDDAVQSDFDQEAQLLEGLRHPNIVSFRDHFLAYRTRFLVLELCDGSDLFRLLRSHGSMDEATVRAILGQIAKGLLYAHRSGVVHRDLKPGNVLVDRNGQVKLADFGLSKLLESEVADSKPVGTPSYMPPEQFRGGQLGPEGDWYALGCLAYEMLKGQILFQRTSWAEMFEKKCRQMPSEEWPRVNASDELCGLIRAALHPDSGQRLVDLESISQWADQVGGLFDVG